MNKKNHKGFTLSELLVVVAIIAVLVAIAIPTLTHSLEKSREATELANLRNAYSTVMAAAIDPNVAEDLTGDTSYGFNLATCEKCVGKVVRVTVGGEEYCMSAVEIVQKQNGWLTYDDGMPSIGNAQVTSSASSFTSSSPSQNKYWYVYFSYTSFEAFLSTI